MMLQLYTWKGLIFIYLMFALIFAPMEGRRTLPAYMFERTWMEGKSRDRRFVPNQVDGIHAQLA